jgi:hypothetical protein
VTQLLLLAAFNLHFRRDSHISHSSSQDANGLQSLVLLRVLRNACAAGPAAAQVLQASDVHMHAAQLAADVAQAQVQVTTLDPEQCKEQHQLLLTSLQLLANLCAAATEAAAAVWQALFPNRLQSILAVLQGKMPHVLACPVCAAAELRRVLPAFIAVAYASR